MRIEQGSQGHRPRIWFWKIFVCHVEFFSNFNPDINICPQGYPPELAGAEVGTRA